MAADFLRSHAIHLDAEMDRVQSGSQSSTTQAEPKESRNIDRILNVSLPNTAPGSKWDVLFTPISNTTSREDNFGPRRIASIQDHTILSEHLAHKGQHTYIDAHGALLAPSFCHPHVHIDKAYLLSHPKYSDLQIERGDFAEAMELTGKAKAKFENWDLLERGQRVVDESVASGVTHMRAFVEVDAGVGRKCLDAGLELKRKAEAEGSCIVQICGFAQLPLLSSSQEDPDGHVIRGLVEAAAREPEVDVLSSTPYVEADREKMEQNVEWIMEYCVKYNKHVDLHLDYNLDSDQEPLVWHVLSAARKRSWNKRNSGKTIVLGHCTRLTLFSGDEWTRLKDAIGDLPVSFVGLPTSDLFMMRTSPEHRSETHRNHEVRGTLDVPRLIKEYGLNVCLGMNNIGNAFTPQGSCDPLTLACNGVGLYQAGTKQDVELLYECVSTRAREAIGLQQQREVEKDAEEDKPGYGLDVKPGNTDLVLFGAEKERWRTRGSVSEAVYLYDHCQNRRGFLGGRLCC